MKVLQSIKDFNYEQTHVLFAFLVIIFTAFSILLFTLLYPGTPKEIASPDPTMRNYHQTPFTLSDAYDVCSKKVQREHGANLMTSWMLDLSSRYDERRNMFLIVLGIIVGNSASSVEGSAYCHIDPKSYELTYYTETLEERSMFLKTMDSFLSIGSRK